MKSHCSDSIENFAFVVRHTGLGLMFHPTFVEVVPVPLLFDASKNALIGHLAKQTIQINQMEEGNKYQIFFSGPHAYISSLWYRTRGKASTWNYLVAQAQGTLELIDELEAKQAVLNQLTREFDPQLAQDKSWLDKIENKEAMLSQITGISLSIESFSSRFKVSQNYGADDIEAAIAGLRASSLKVFEPLIAKMRNS